MSGASLTIGLGELAIEGWSRAGEETWLRVAPPGIAFDVGRGPLALAGVRDLFLTHGHLDHALGLPFLLSRRAIEHPAGRRVVCPRAIADDLRAFIAAAERLEGSTFPFELIAVEPGDRIAVGKGLVVEVFATDHVVPSVGYHLVRERRSLCRELRGLESAALAARRRAGEPVEEVHEERWLSYCGDSSPAVFELAPEIAVSRVLAIECTFIAPAHCEHGRGYKHVHLDDLVALQDRLENEVIVLYHLSRRHRRRELEAEVARRLPALAERIRLLV